MSDPIAPALDAAEWPNMIDAWRRTAGSGAYPYMGDSPDENAWIIAANNWALPDDDPRKITRDWVRAMRDLANAIESAQGSKMVGAIRLTGPAGTTHVSTGNDWRGMADALESYLPPEAAP